MTDTDNTTANGPIHAYRALIREGEIHHDPAQELAVEKLQLLHHALRSYDPAPDRGWKKFFAFGRSQGAEPPQGLYMYGGVGRGKSMLMDLFYDTAPVALKRRIHFHEFMLEVHAQAHELRQSRNSAKDNEADPVPVIADRIAGEATLLCFDEFHVTDIADAMILGRLFSALFERGTIVVTTSNRVPDDLYKDGLNRQLFLPFIDLLKQKCDVLHLDSPTDYRMQRLQQMPVYLHPLNEDTARQLDQDFQQLTEGAAIRPATLEMQGRTLDLAETGAGVARATFAELCDRPLGAADYLELAGTFHTLILASIPKMTKAERNQAKRFVTLIDALYENRTKLVCTAGAPPEELYPAGDGAFEFHRTVSRLMEMQSAEYIAEPHAKRGQDA